MGYIKKLKENELIGGISDTDVYPITASSAVYHNGASLDKVIGDIKEGMTPLSIVNKNAVLEYGKKSIIATVDNDIEITVTMPESTKANVVNKNETLEFENTKTIAVIDNIPITVTLPRADNVTMESKSTTLDYGNTYDIAKVNINGEDKTISVTMPEPVPVNVVDRKATFNYGETAEIATINDIPITITMPKEYIPDTLFISVSNWSEFIKAYNEYNSVNGTKSTKANVELSFTDDITVGSAKTLNLTNFVIHGHYHKWINNYTTTLTGTYAKFEGVYFQQGNFTSLKLFNLDGETSSSSEYNFERCRFRDFFEGSTITLMSLNNNTARSTHVVIISCKFANGSVSGNNCTMLFDVSGTCEDNNATSVTITNTLNGNKSVECYKFAITNNGISSNLGNNDNLVYDNSMTYNSSYKMPNYYRNISIARS